MSKLASVLSVVAVVAATSAVSAGEYRRSLPLFPAPAILGFDEKPETVPMPMPEVKKHDHDGHEHGHKHVETIKLFDCVKYRDLDHIAPCAVPTIVKVANPCWKPSPCGCCAPKVPKCVYVKICVPKVTECHHHHHCAPKPPTCGAPKAPACCAPKVACCAPAPKCCHKCHSCNNQHKKLKVTCLNGGKYVKYDYGKYRIEIRVKKDHVEVDYDN